MSNPREYLQVAVQAIIEKALSDKNAAKGDWRTLTPEECEHFMRIEFAELEVELQRGDYDAAFREAVDVLAFGAMRKALVDGTVLDSILHLQGVLR